MLPAYVAKKAFEKFTGAGQRRYEDVETYKKRVLRRRLAMGAVSLSAALGVFAGAHNGNAERVEYSAEAGKARVTYIDRQLSKISIIGFETNVDNVKAKAVEHNRPLGDALPLDLWREMTVDHFSVTSELCMDAGSRKIEKTEEPNGKTSLRVVINPERDMYVCSRENLGQTPTETIDGSVNALIKDGITNIERTFNKTSDEAKKANAIWATLGQAARTAAEITVNKKCAPLVFGVTQADAKRLIADGLRRDDNEVIEVDFTAGPSGDVKLTGQSDAGECTVPASVARGKDERATRN